MKIKNTSLKVIGIAGKNILPDQVAEIDEKTAALPAVERYMELGFLKRDEQEQQHDLPDDGLDVLDQQVHGVVHRRVALAHAL